MTKILDEVLAANAQYAESFGDKGNLPLPPSRHFAILTCMDARLDPAKYAGLAEGDAHVIRQNMPVWPKVMPMSSAMQGGGQPMTRSGHW
jgi:carbonic anhydrase